MDYEAILDKVIQQYEYDRQSHFGIGQIIRNNTGFENNKPLTPNFQSEILPEIERLIVKYGYGKAEDFGREFYKITQAWKDAKEAGGHFKYQAYLSNLKNEERIDRELQRKKLFYETDVAANIFKDYPVVKKERKILLIVAIIELVAIIAGLLWQLQDKS